jgi:hypothetical protein
MWTYSPFRRSSFGKGRTSLGFAWGGANTKLFHARANGRRRKVYIQSLISDTGTAITAKDKEEILVQHFNSILSTTAPRQLALDWVSLDYFPQDLSELDDDFDEQEIKEVVFSLPSVKARLHRCFLQGLLGHYQGEHHVSYCSHGQPQRELHKPRKLSQHHPHT